MADDGEYAVFDPPRYFSSEHLKLTYKVRSEIRYCERCKINLVLKWYKKSHYGEVVLCIFLVQNTLHFDAILHLGGIRKHMLIKMCPSGFLYSKQHWILIKVCCGVYIMKCWMELMLHFVRYLSIDWLSQKCVHSKKRYIVMVSTPRPLLCGR